jgi:short-subunit dehydrogenase
LSLEGRAVFVSGATSGVGRALALAAGEAGAVVFATGRDAERLDDLKTSIHTAGGVAHAFPADLTNEGDVRELRRFVEGRAAGLDALVHCAGSIIPGTIEASDPNDMDTQLRLNFRAPYVLTRSLLPLLRANRGYVVFVNSTAGLVASAGSAAYSASKHALRGLADSLRAEVNRDGIRVMSLFLGRTATPMQEAVHAYEGRSYHPERLIQPSDAAQVVISILSLPHTAEVTEVRVRPTLKSQEDH